MKVVYSGLFIDNNNWELAETFYNSITRWIFTTVGGDSQIEFVATDFEMPPNASRSPVYRTYRRAPYTAKLVEHIITDFEFDEPFADLSRDARLAAGEVAHIFPYKQKQHLHI